MSNRVATYSADESTDRGPDGQSEQNDKEENDLHVDHLFYSCSLDWRGTSRDVSDIKWGSNKTRVALSISLVS